MEVDTKFSEVIDEASQHFVKFLDNGAKENLVECHLGMNDYDSHFLVDAKFSILRSSGLLLVEVSLMEVKRLYISKVSSSSSPMEKSLIQEMSLPPILTSPITAGLSFLELSTLLMVMPSNYVLWNARRKKILDYIIEGFPKGNANFFIKEFLFTSLLLSVHSKIDSIWSYRFFILEKMFCSSILNTQQFINLFKYDCNVINLSAHSHSMNYNGWNYRRKLYSLCIDRCTFTQDIFSSDLDSVLEYITLSNGDQSACSYLFFLLEKFEKFSPDVCVSQLWKRLMIFTQNEIRNHCECGHECMWELRWILIVFALNQNCTETKIFSSWSINDELEFASTYADFYNSSPSLLFPEGFIRGWYENSGSPPWTSYFACRYALRLLKLFRSCDK